MKQKQMAVWLRVVIIGFAVFTAAAYAFVIPALGHQAVRAMPEFSYAYMPWLTLALASAVPVAAALVLCWQITGTLKKERPFVPENAVRLKRIAMLAFFDVALVLVCEFVFFFFRMNHAGIFLLSFIPGFVAVAFGICCLGLAQLVEHAADLQQQSDLTI